MSDRRVAELLLLNRRLTREERIALGSLGVTGIEELYDNSSVEVGERVFVTGDSLVGYRLWYYIENDPSSADFQQKELVIQIKALIVSGLVELAPLWSAAQLTGRVQIVVPSPLDDEGRQAFEVFGALEQEPTPITASQLHKWWGMPRAAAFLRKFVFVTSRSIVIRGAVAWSYVLILHEKDPAKILLVEQKVDKLLEEITGGKAQ